MTLSILSKFETIQLDPLSRISDEDGIYCNHQQRLFEEAITFMNDILIRMKEMISTYEGNGYIDNYDDQRHIEKRIEDIQSQHISKICSYFEKKYKVSLQECKTGINRKYKESLNIHYKDIVEEIFIDLGGYTFDEKAVRLIKENFSRGVSQGYNKPLIKGAKLIIKNYTWVDDFKKKWDKVSRLSYSARDKFIHMFNALSHFETNEIQPLGYYYRLSEVFQDSSLEHFTRHELGYNKVQSIRLFQNGKVEIEFESYEQAKSFLDQYIIES